jgi:hypothetical protein
MNKELRSQPAREALAAAQHETAMAHAQSAALWISSNRPDIAFDVQPKMLLVADEDEFALPELEDFGRAGSAVKLCSGPFGELWWRDPEGRETAHHECLLYVIKAASAATRRTVLLRFSRPCV